MKFRDYLLLYLKEIEGKETGIPSIKFWAMTTLIIGTGMKIQMNNGHYLTGQDCWNEMDDLLNGIEYDGGWVRAWWEQYQWLRGFEKPDWV